MTSTPSTRRRLDGVAVDEVLADAVDPPFAPGKAINAKDAESIGDFASLGDDVPLSDGDFLCGNQGRIDGVGTPDV